ncbi:MULTISPECIES: exodeoxyribonuclease VII small subunit [Exiguobacterium]|uniref:Exodeoxyribonuclease 7 small subunit n=1 Tax=Exiguobacterium mexicanum TaxID=340146 RepID=A0ABT7MQ32_9BACL|nr:MULTISPECIES: exodeoxyribonuclease VII small subunit [Exiguobacterium]KAB2862408.1 MAG: exodeoxyribonuclease VII small subunit [Exiguobacterium chiriqhucha]MCT4776530.1 exodeoxyribonuclease VII small subunit [Exiguobacterium aquaticum]MCT4788801.1 exodeoxyribonuclease VII small subunit [Exiguobacterium mexicanum]MDL5377319.1 exodeoxyribonuclease VII small subunit [Exiguobacterium mexicanum]TCI72577.1 exodeoxyribonuclease VII small subunit [Exiguobacterium sp. IPCI3]
MAKQQAEQTFEAALARLEEIVTQLETGEVALEEAMTLYEEGVRLSALCQAKLTAAEQKMDEILELDGTLREKGGTV